MESSARVAHSMLCWEQRQIMRHVGGGSDSSVTPVTESPDSRHTEGGFCFQICKISFFVQLSVKHISFCIFRVYVSSFVRLGCDVTIDSFGGTARYASTDGAGCAMDLCIPIYTPIYTYIYLYTPIYIHILVHGLCCLLLAVSE